MLRERISPPSFRPCVCLLAGALAACAPPPAPPAEPVSITHVSLTDAPAQNASEPPPEESAADDGPDEIEEGEAQEFGMIGLLGADEVGGLTGTIDPSTLEGGGFGTLGTSGGGVGFGSAKGGVGSAEVSVAGRLAPEIIRRIVRQSYGRIRNCYERVLATNPTLGGKLIVKFVIGRDGKVTRAEGTGDLTDEATKSCILSTFVSLTFPAPEGGVVTVSYPIVLVPSDDVSPASSPVGVSQTPRSRRR